MSAFELVFLVDNTVMELVPDQGPVARLSEPGRGFLAEHGFSLLLTTSLGQRLLLDAGATDRVLPHNLALLGLDIASSIDAAVLSHGHSDHTGSVRLLRCPIHALPGIFGPRYLERGGELRFDLSSPGLRFARDRLILSDAPVQVFPDVWTTGPVPRVHDWEKPRGFVRARGTALEPDDVADDQGLAVVTDEGLVVIAGCAHAGIVNTVLQARTVTGVTRIHAVVGGFHLIDASAEKLERTVSELRALEAGMVAPTHCTGFAATARLAQEFGERFVYVTGGHCLSLGGN